MVTMREKSLRRSPGASRSRVCVCVFAGEAGGGWWGGGGLAAEMYLNLYMDNSLALLGRGRGGIAIWLFLYE